MLDIIAKCYKEFHQITRNNEFFQISTRKIVEIVVVVMPLFSIGEIPSIAHTIGVKTFLVMTIRVDGSKNSYKIFWKIYTKMFIKEIC